MMKRFIRQKKRNTMSMGMVLLIAVCCLSVVYAALCSVIYMFGSGSIEISYKDLYYWVDTSTGKGNFYRSCTDGEVDKDSSTDFTTMAQAVNAIKNGGNIYMLSTYVPGKGESVSVNTKTITIQRYVSKTTTSAGVETIKAAFTDGPLFDVSTDFKIELAGTKPCLAINGNEVKGSAGAFKVSNGAKLTLNNSETTSITSEGNNGGIFTINENYCSLSIDSSDSNVLYGGGAIYALGGQVDAKNIRFEGNRSTNTGEAFGGAIYAANNGAVKSDISLENCSFTNNTARNLKLKEVMSSTYAWTGVAPAYGGAVCVKGSTVNMTQCTFTGNAVDVYKKNNIRATGGAVYIDSTSSGSMKDCTVESNQSSYCIRSGAGVCVEAGDNAFALSGKTIIKNNSCYFVDPDSNNGINANDNLYLSGDGSNISIDTSKISEGSNIFVNVNPEPAKNGDLKALISDDIHRASSADFFHSDIGGYKAQIENSSNYKGLYLVSSSEYDDLWYRVVSNVSTVTGYNYKSFFYKDKSGVLQDTGLAHFVDAVASLNDKGTIHMQTIYNPSISETITLPGNKNVNVIRENDNDESYSRNSMFGIGDVTFTVNAADPSSSITFDGNKSNAGSVRTMGGVFEVYGTSTFVLNGADKSTGDGKTITIKDSKVSSCKGGGVRISSGSSSISNCAITGCESEGDNGGGIYYYVGGQDTATLKNCTITGNKASLGGGIYCDNTEDNLLLLGKVTIKGNTNGNGADDNLYFRISEYFNPTVTLTSSDSTLSDGSEIGVATSKSPEEGSPVKFASSATEAMKACFTPDVSDYVVRFASNENALYLAVPTYSELWYKADENDSNTKKFFEGSDVNNLTATDITKFSKAVQSMSASGKIHMLTTYESAADETTTVPASKNITVLRDGTFNNASMFSITKGTFEIDATDASSSITFDGNKIETKVNEGGAFNANGGSINFKGADKSGGGKTITIQNNIISSSSAYGGGVYISGRGTNTLTNCSITGNTISSSSPGAFGGGVYIGGSGTNTLTNCSITENKAEPSFNARGGGVCIYGGTNSLSNCSITGNTISSASAYGGGVCIYSGTSTLTSCSITGNTISSSSASAYGGGVCIYENTTLLGTTNITGNTVKNGSDSSDSNLYLASSSYTVALSDSSGNKLSAGSQIGVTTDSDPTSGTDQKFATNATEDEMMNYFTSDKGYVIYKQGTELYLTRAPSNLYQSDNKFYLDAEKTKLTNIKTMAEAVKIATNIHMLSVYTASSDETVEVPSGKNVTVSRYSTFVNDAMIRVNGGNLIVKATDTTSSITFDGQNVETTVKYADGGIIHVAGTEGTSLTLTGADNNGTKTINFVNSFVKGPSAGGAIRNNGTATLTNCNISNNKASPTDGGSIAGGVSNFGTLTMESCLVNGNSTTGNMSGGIYAGSNAIKSTIKNCQVTNNSAKLYGGGIFLSGGGSDNSGSPISIIEDCTVTGNTAGDSTATPAVNGYGAGIYIGAGANGTSTISRTTISKNNAAGGGGLYISDGTNTITSCTISNNQKSSWGGGVRIDGGTNKFEGCSVINNEASSRGGGFYLTKAGSTTLIRCTISGNIAPAQGGAGIFFTKNADGTAGTLALSGAMSITGNKTKDSTDENNLLIGDGLTIDVSGLGSGSAVSVSTVVPPGFGAPVTFATNANETIKGYFSSDDDNYKVILNGTDLQLGMNDFENLWYQADTTDKTKKFFRGADKDHLIATKIFKLSDAVNMMRNEGTIHMLTSYDSKEDETTTVPASKNIKVVRDSSFAIDSMFKITGGNFTINAPDKDSSLTFDGQNVEITEIINGGAFNVSGDNTQFTLNGAEDKKNIIVTNNIISKYSTDTSSYEGDVTDHYTSGMLKYLGSNGGGIANMGSGKVTLSNCLISKNKAVMSGAGIVSFGDLTMNSCDVTENYLKDIQFTFAGAGGGVACLRGTSTLEGCRITSNAAVYLGGGISSLCEKGTFSNCKINNNTCLGSLEYNGIKMNGFGGGILCGDGINTVENCEIMSNTASYSGGMYISDTYIETDNLNKNNVATISNCTISNNKSKSDSGGVTSRYHVSIFKDCSITGNTIDGDTGGGMKVVGGTVTLLGTMKITDNIKTSDSSSSNLYFSNDNSTEISILSDDLGNKLSTDSRIGVSARTTPPVKFAEKGDETMEGCFESDNASYTVMRIDSDFYLQPIYDNLYYSTKSGSGKFYSDSSCSKDTFMTKLSQTMKCANSGCKIYMMNQYVSSADETVDVPAGKDITVYRHSSFTTASMFNITGGTFTVNAPYASSSIAFDGNNLAASVQYGGGFYINGSSTKFILNGADKSGGGKTISIQNNKNEYSSTAYGGGIYINGGTSKFTNCSIISNTVSVKATGSPIATGSSRGGGAYINGGTNTFNSCNVTGNDCTGSGGIKLYFGGGIYINGGTNTMIGTMNITGNSSGNNGKNLYIVGAKTIALSSDSESLSTSSNIGILTSNTPDLSTSIQFATSATEEMKECFTSDNSEGDVFYENSGLYVKRAYENLYYKSGYFYSDSNCSDLYKTSMTKLSDAVNHVKDGKSTSLSNMSKGKIYFKNQYSHSDETITVPRGYRIAIVRDVSVYSDSSMIDIHGGCTFKIFVPYSNSNLIIDGGSKTSSGSEGGLFNVNEYSSNHVTLQGTDANNKNLTVQNFWSNGVGGAICFDKGTSTIKYCNFKGNKVTSTGTGCKGGAIFIGNDSNNTHNISDCYFTENEALYSNGGAIRAENGTNSITNCYFESNKAKYGGALAFCDGTNTVTKCTMRYNATANKGSGGAIDDYNGKNTYTDCTIENNTCDGVEGGGFCVNNQGTNDSKITFAGKMVIINNTASGSKCNVYIIDNKIFTIASNFSTESHVGITTKVSPSDSTAVEFATGVTDSMDAVKYCFEHDPGTYRVIRALTNLLIGNSMDKTYSDLYYYRESNASEGKFYTDINHSSVALPVKTTFKDAIGSLNKGGKIHMLSSYNTSTSGETIVIPPNLGTITIVRDSSFKTESMINVNGSFEIEAPHASSTLVFDGDNQSTSGVGGGVLWLYEKCSIKIRGASSSNRNIKFINNVISSPGAGAIRIGAGSNNILSYCVIENNKNENSSKDAKQSGGILVTASDSPNATDTAVEITGCDIKNNSSRCNCGGVYVVSGSAKLYSCTISGNTATSYYDSSFTSRAHGGGVCFDDGTNILSSCNITDNKVTSYSGAAFGAGVYIGNGTNTLSSCTVRNNTSFAYVGGVSRGGGVYIDNGTNSLSNCNITENTASYGGGAYISGGTNTLSGCTIKSNTASKDGGGLYIDNGTNTLLGVITASDNTVDSSSNNLYLKSGNTVALSNSSGSKLSSSSYIGVITGDKPTSGNDVKFATGVTDSWTKGCFFSDSASYDVAKKDDNCLYLTAEVKTYTDLYYKNGMFYSDEDLTDAVVNKFSGTMGKLTSSGTIHMLSRYYSSVDETVDVPAGKNITVIRDKSFTNNSMFYISAGSFTINATDPTSSITFDGNKANAAPTNTYDGGVFHNGTSGGKFTLNGNNKNGGGKTITIQNSKGIGSGWWGAAICNHGQLNVTNCAMLNNEVEGSGGAMYISAGASVIKDCTLTGNKAKTGGGIYCSGGTTTMLGTMTMTNNSASTGSDVCLASNYILTLSSGSESLSTNSNIGIRTSTDPTDTASIKFATGATNDMVSCFTPTADSSSYKVVYKDGGLYLFKSYSYLYYKDSKFYSDDSCSKNTGLTKLSEAVQAISSGGTIYIRSQYAPSTDETVNVPAGKSITVCRSSVFKTASMFKITGVTFTVNATDPSSSITFDGNKSSVTPTSTYDGGIFHSNDTGSTLVLNGASKNGGGKTITLQNSKVIGSNYWGGAICTHGRADITNCAILNNESEGDGGAILISSGTSVIKDCTLTGNKSSSKGGGIYCSGGVTTMLGTMTITDNSANSGSDVYLSNGYTLALSSGSESLSTNSKIGVRTSTDPTDTTNVKFATGATADMADCFTSNAGSVYKAVYEGGNLYFEVYNEKQITLSSSTPSIRITPEGYYTPQTSTTLNSFTGTYVLTGSYKGTSSSKNPDVVFENTSTERKTIKVKIKDLSLEAYTWCSLGLLEGNGPMDIYITAEGTNSLQGYNHPAFNINSDKVQGSNMYLNVKSGSTLLGSTNKEAPRRVAADGINFYFNGTLLTSEQKNKNTTFTSTGYTQ